ncbi:hypothetical protein GLOIN_2v1612261 [Rhizophagus clarus]|nr:hypothetical protein GLOIN_2v1612261 [Rhizophagus clarus]
MDDKRIYLHVIGWGIPAILTIVALKTYSINYQFATLCFVKVEASNVIFFYPLAVIVVPIFFIHMTTSSYIYWTGRKGKKSNPSFSVSIAHLIRIQWRELLLFVLFFVTVTIYWLFYCIELKSIVTRNNSDVNFLDWINCIQSGKGRSFCANNIASKFMPHYSLILIAEISASLIGVYLFVTIFNEILWLELNQWISETFSSKEIL